MNSPNVFREKFLAKRGNALLRACSKPLTWRVFAPAVPSRAKLGDEETAEARLDAAPVTAAAESWPARRTRSWKSCSTLLSEFSNFETAAGEVAAD